MDITTVMYTISMINFIDRQSRRQLSTYYILLVLNREINNHVVDKQSAGFIQVTQTGMQSSILILNE
jgi:hypothetical protein